MIGDKVRDLSVTAAHFIIKQDFALSVIEGDISHISIFTVISMAHSDYHTYETP